MKKMKKMITKQTKNKKTPKTPTFNTKNFQQIIKTKQKKTKIIAVTKNFSIKAVDLAIKNNIKIIGENKIQETTLKFEKYKKRKKIELHLIGHLQTNKTKKAVKLYDVIETADTPKVIFKINKEAEKIQKKQKIYFQINIGRDPKKQGFLEEEIEDVCKQIKTLKNIKIKGIMTILQQKTTEKEKKRLYLKTKKIQQKIQQKHFTTCTDLSMGMSGDYKIASNCGATHVRIGTLLYGKRL